MSHLWLMALPTHRLLTMFLDKIHPKKQTSNPTWKCLVMPKRVQYHNSTMLKPNLSCQTVLYIQCPNLDKIITFYPEANYIVPPGTMNPSLQGRSFQFSSSLISLCTVFKCVVYSATGYYYQILVES